MRRLLLRPLEAAEALGLSRTKIYLLLSTGELPSVRVGGSVRISADALENWIHERQAASTGIDEASRTKRASDAAEGAA